MAPAADPTTPVADPTTPAAKPARNYDRFYFQTSIYTSHFHHDPKHDDHNHVLDAEYRFDKDEGDKVVDASGKDNHGTARGALLGEGRGGGKSRRFDGKGYLEVPKSASLNPAVASWTVEVTFQAEKPDGILLARGGRSNGYCLHLEGGKPVFTVVSQGRASRVVAGQAVGTDWVRVTARIAGVVPLRAPVRIIAADFDHADFAGFAYETLPGHPERGREAFYVTRTDGLVEFTVTAFSKPAAWYSRLGGPITHVVQNRYTNKYLLAMAIQPR